MTNKIHKRDSDLWEILFAQFSIRKDTNQTSTLKIRPLLILGILQASKCTAM